MRKQQRYPVEVEFDGKAYTATYSADSGVLSVWFMTKDGLKLGPFSELSGHGVASNTTANNIDRRTASLARFSVHMI